MTHRVDKNWGKPHSHCTLRYVCAYIIMKSSAQKTFWTSIVACLLICSQLVFRENAIYSQDITTLQCIEDTRWYLQDWNFRCKKGNVTHWVHLHGWEDWEVIYKGLSALTTQFSPPSGWRGSSWRWNFWYELEIGDTYDSHHNVYNQSGWILRPQDGLLLQFPLLSKYLKHTKLSRAAVSNPSQLPKFPTNCKYLKYPKYTKLIRAASSCCQQAFPAASPPQSSLSSPDLLAFLLMLLLQLLLLVRPMVLDKSAIYK